MGAPTPVQRELAGSGSAQRRLAGWLGLPDLGNGLMGSSFYYSRPHDADAAGDTTAGWLGEWAAWGETATTAFSGAEGSLSLDGEVATATLGADSRRGRWLAGIALSHSEGEGRYSHAETNGGMVSSALSSLHPYLHFSMNERTSVWGVIGAGVGELSLRPDGTEKSLEAQLSNTMAAFGGRGVLAVRGSDRGGFELAIRSDALLTNTVSDETEGLMGGSGATSRVRVLLEGTGSVPLSTGAVLTPRLEAGLRYDGGDAETGAGLEIGGGLGFAAGRINVQVDARTLVAHEDTEYEEWGFSGSIEYRPRSDGRGFNASVGSAWGATGSGVNALWSRPTASGLARGGAPMAMAQRFTAQFGYGLDGRKGRSVWEPYLGAESGEGSHALRMGLRLTSGPNAELGLELGRRLTMGGEPEAAFQIGGRILW